MNNRSFSGLNGICAAALLVLMAVLAGGAAWRESVTVDEVAHVGAGVSYLQRLDLRMNFEHPPLAKVIAGLPLVWRGVRADYSNFSWTYSAAGFHSMLGEWSFGHWLLTVWNEPRATLAWARAAMLLVTLVLGFMIYWCGSRVADARGALLCLAAFVATPAFLAFGPLVLTDVPVALFSLLTAWTFATLWRSPRRASVARFALALAAALLTKFSAGLLLLACVAFALSLRWFPIDEWGQPGQRAGWRSLGKGVLGAALIVYAVCLLLSWNQPTNDLAVMGSSPAALAVRRLLMPLAVWAIGLAAFGIQASRPTFLLGHAYSHGVWFYFPVVLILKSTLAFLALMVLAAGIAITARRRLRKRPIAIQPGSALHWRAIWVFLLVFAAACVLSRLDLSIRHFTIPLVFLILLLAPLPRVIDSMSQAGWKFARAGNWCLLVLAAISIISVARAYPYYLPFLNSLSLGHPGYELLNDSNVDWNQALPEVQRFVERRGLGSVLIDDYGFSEPSVYVPRGQFWNCQQPAPSDGGRWAVVSANMIIESHNCPWLLRLPHESLAGGSMYAFQLPPAIPAAGAPGGPPLRENWHNLAGTPGAWPDLRLIFLRGVRDPQQLPAAMQELATVATPEHGKLKSDSVGP